MRWTAGWPRVGVWAAALAAAGCSPGGGETRWRGTVRQHGAEVEVANPTRPVFGPGAVAARLAWATPRGDGAAEGWSRPVRLALGGHEVYVLDQLAHAVHVVSRSGAPLREIGREGDGPGELRAPFGVALVDGVLAVGEAARNSVELFSPAGEPRGAVPLGTVAVSLVGVEPGAVLVKTFRGEQRLYGLTGSAPPVELPPYTPPEGRRRGAAPCFRLWGAEDRILRLDCTQPLFQVLGRDGRVMRTVRIEREPVPATRGELELYRRELSSRFAQSGYPGGGSPAGLIESLTRDQDPKLLMRGVRYDTRAHLYALWEQQPQELGNGPARLHLFGREGVFLASLAFPAPWVDFAVDGLTVYALEEDAETGLVRLAAYTLTLTPQVRRLADAPARK